MNAGFRVQQYEGKPVLTFWQGTIATPPAYTNVPEVRILSRLLQPPMQPSIANHLQIQSLGLDSRGIASTEIQGFAWIQSWRRIRTAA